MTDDIAQVELTDSGKQLHDALPLYLKLKKPKEEKVIDAKNYPFAALAQLFGGSDEQHEQNYVVLRVNDFDQAVGHNIDHDMFFVHVHGKDIFPDKDEADRFFDLNPDQRQKKIVRGDNPFSEASQNEVAFWLSHESYPWRLAARELIAMVHECEEMISRMLDDDFQFDTEKTQPKAQAALLGAAKAIRRGEHPFTPDMVMVVAGLLEPYMPESEKEKMEHTFDSMKKQMAKPFDLPAEVPVGERRAIFEEKLEQLRYWWAREFPGTKLPDALERAVEQQARAQEYDWVAVDQCREWIVQRVEARYGDMAELHRSQRLQAAEFVASEAGSARAAAAIVADPEHQLLGERVRKLLWRATEPMANPYSDKFLSSEAVVYNKMAESDDMSQTFQVAAERNAKFFIAESAVMSPFVGDSGLGQLNHMAGGVCMPQGRHGATSYVDRVYFATGGMSLLEEGIEQDASAPDYVRKDPLDHFWGIIHHELGHYRDMVSMKLFGEIYANDLQDQEAVIKNKLMVFGKALRELREEIDQKAQEIVDGQVAAVVGGNKPSFFEALWDVVKAYLVEPASRKLPVQMQAQEAVQEKPSQKKDPITLSVEAQEAIAEWLGVSEMPTNLQDAQALIELAEFRYIELLDHVAAIMPFTTEELERYMNITFIDFEFDGFYQPGAHQQNEIPARLQQLDYQTDNMPALVPAIFGKVWDKFVEYRDDVTRYFEQKFEEKNVSALIQWDGMTEQLDVYQEMERATDARQALPAMAV